MNTGFRISRRIKKSLVSFSLILALVAGNVGYSVATDENIKVAQAADEKIYEAASNVNYSAILGRAVDYGLLSKTYVKGAHMESTLATYTYTGGDNNDIDLTDTGTAQIMIGELTDSSAIVLGKTGAVTKYVNVEAPKEVLDTISLADGFNAKLLKKETSKEAISSNITAMIKHISDESTNLSTKANNASYKVDLSEVATYASPHYTLDLSDPKYKDVVVYVNIDKGSNLQSAISRTGNFHIKKYSSTVVVMNYEEAGSIYVNKYDVTVVDGSNKAIDTETDYSGNISERNKEVDKEICQKIIWNFPNATNVTLNIAAGTFLIPNENANACVEGQGAGWVATGGTFKNNAEWHYVYEGVSEDTNADEEGQIHFSAKKTFTDDINVVNPIQDYTVKSKAGDFTFYFYETGSDYNIEKGKLVEKKVKGNTVEIVNEGTNKIKFPTLCFYTDEEHKDSDYYIPATKDANSKTFYYVVKEKGAGTRTSKGIKISNGEIDIALTVTNTDGVLSYVVNSKTYLDADKKLEYKNNENIKMSGVEFSLGSFFNEVEPTVQIRKADQFGNEVPGAKLTLTGQSTSDYNVYFFKSDVTLGEGASFSGTTWNNYGWGDNTSSLSWVSGTTDTYILNIADGTYTLTEETAPDGYEKSETVTFTVKNGKVVSVANGSQSNNTVVMTDDKRTDVSIDKVDQFGAEVKGATLKLERTDDTSYVFSESQMTLGTDATSKGVKNNSISWVSGTTATKISVPTGSYKLTELEAPNGYNMAESVTFDVKRGKITNEASTVEGTTVKMVDKKIVLPITISKQTSDGTALEGATLKLTGVEKKSWGEEPYTSSYNAVFGANTYQDENLVTPAGGNTYWTSEFIWKSTDTSRLLYNLPNGTYTITETEAPEGYKIADPVTFTVESGNVTKINGIEVANSTNEVVIVDQSESATPTLTTVQLSKKDVSGKEISGAQLTLTGTDVDNKAISFTESNFDDTAISISTEGTALNWISDENGAKTIKDLPDGTYTMHEEVAPTGYVLATDITFTVKEGKVKSINGVEVTNDSNLIAMVDEAEPVVTPALTTVQLSKKNVSGEEISGAELTLTGTAKAGGAVVFTDKNIGTTTGITISTDEKTLSWTSDKNGAKSVKNLPDGTYTMHEEVAPSGYKVATDITFTVENGKVTKVNDVTVSATDSNVITMVDDGITTVKLSKTDVSGNEISGAQLTLKGKDKKNADVVFTSENTGTDKDIAISTDGKKLSWTSDANGAKSIINLPNGTYTMTEVAAPEGYVVATDITFTVENGKVKEVTGTTATSADSNVIVMVDKALATVELSKTDVLGNEISGAELTLKGTAKAGGAVVFTDKNIGTTTGITISADKKTLSWTSDKNGAKSVKNLPDGTYTMHEEAAPSGYKVATDITFTVENGKVTKVNDVAVSSTAGNVITMVDDGITTVELSKKNVLGNEISGAQLTLKGKDTKNADVVFTSENTGTDKGIAISTDKKTLSWTSDANGAKSIINLPNGTYVMHEVAAPEGYVVATDITFEVANGKVTNVTGTTATSADSNVIVMVDKALTTVQLSKTDVLGSEISGAELTLTGTDAAGNVVTFTTDNFDAESGITITEAEKKLSWVSDANGAKTIKALPDGTYRMSEVSAPSGYKVATDITFTVAAGKVTKVNDVAVSSTAGNVITMVDDGITTVELSKKNVSGDEISGAKMTLTGTDTKGADVTFTSTQIGADTSIAISTDGKTLSWTSDANGAKSIINLPNGTYVMHEVAAPDGYEVATDITFTVANGKVTSVTGTTATSADSNVIVMVDKALATVELSKTDVSGNEISGAQLTLTGTAKAGGAVAFTDKNIGTTTGITISTDGTTLSWTSDKNGAKTIKDLPDGTYIMHEEVAPSGYKVATDITFTVENGKVTKVNDVAVSSTAGNVITMVDDGITTVELSKKNVSGNEISGAQLTLTGKDTKNADVEFTSENTGTDKDIAISTDGKKLSWTSDANGAKSIINLPNGTYVMHEVTAPEGYVVATDITFEVANGKVTNVTGTTATSADSNVIVMVDKALTTVQLSKTDVLGSEISGAELTLTGTDAAGNVVTFTTDNFDAESGITITEAGKKLSWVSDANGAKTIKDLPDGTYRMSEVAAPNGYKVATDITFTVEGW